MVNWRRIAGTASALAACGILIAQGQLAIHKGEFLIASNARIRAAEASMSQLQGSTPEQYLKVSLEVERECKRLYAEQSFTLDRYFISQSFLLIGSYGCLFAASLGLSLWRAEPMNDAELPN